MIAEIGKRYKIQYSRTSVLNKLQTKREKDVRAQLRRRDVAASPDARRTGQERGSVERSLTHTAKCDILTLVIPQVEEPRECDQLRYSRRAP